jgi:hypothetical protein
MFTRLMALLVCFSAVALVSQTSAGLPNALEAPPQQAKAGLPPQQAKIGLAGDPGLAGNPSATLAGIGVAPNLPEASLPSLQLRSLSQFPSFIPAQPPLRRPRTVDKKFVTLGALVFGLTVMDMELTQYCLHRHTCVELDPALPQSHFGMYATSTPVNLAVMYFAYRLRAARKKAWWVAPLVDIGSHATGVGSNVRFLGK